MFETQTHQSISLNDCKYIPHSLVFIRETLNMVSVQRYNQGVTRTCFFFSRNSLLLVKSRFTIGQRYWVAKAGKRRPSAG